MIHQGPLKDVLTRSEPDSATVERLLAHMRSDDTKRGVRSAWLAVAAGVVVATGAAALLRAVLVEEGVTVEQTRLEQTLQRHPSGNLELSDGSSLVVEPGALLAAEQNDEDAVALRLSSGKVAFHVNPQGSRRWAVLAPGVRLDVVGTVFTVDVKAAGVTINVEHGVVMLSGERVPNRHLRLTDGQSFSTEAPRAWLDLARRGELAQAAASLGPQGLADEASGALPMSERLLLADVAAAVPDMALSERLLGEVAQNSTEPLERALAAYKRGLRLQEDLGEPKKGAQSLEQALEAGLPAALQRDAYLRTAQAWMQAGDTARARHWLERADAAPTKP